MKVWLLALAVAAVSGLSACEKKETTPAIKMDAAVTAVKATVDKGVDDAKTATDKAATDIKAAVEAAKK